MSRLIRIFSVCPLVFDFFNIILFILNFFRNLADIILSSAFLALYELKGERDVCCYPSDLL